MTVTLHCAPVVLPMAADPVTDGAVLVDGDRIVAVGPRRELDAERVREWPGILTPGLVNAHAHLEYGPPFADLAVSGLPFPAWIAELTRRRHAMTAQDWQMSARGSGHQLLQAGTTAVADLVSIGPAVAVAASLGLQGVSYGELAGVDDAGWAEALPRLERILALPGRTMGVSPHTLYTLSAGVFRNMVEHARARGMRLHPHLAETADEAEWVLSGTGAFQAFVERFHEGFAGVGAGVSPTRHCDDLGGLGPDVHVAHGVHVDADDRALLRERGTAVALCTRSNAILAAGEAPVADYLREGSPIALGTDSLASSPDLDLLAEAKATCDLARRQGARDPEQAVITAATVGGARALGLPLGTLEAGARADFAVFDVPVDGDPFVSLVEHGAGRCRATVLGGRLVHRR